MILRGIGSETEILTRSLTFESIASTDFADAYIGRVSQLNGGYSIADSTTNPRLYLSLLNGQLVTTRVAYPFNLQSTSVSNLWFDVVAGALYSLEDTTWRLRFLPTLLYIGGSTTVIRDQKIIELERTITYTDPGIYYFTNTADSRDNILYRYSYGSYCSTLAKGYCPYVSNYEYETSAGSAAYCHLDASRQGLTCGDTRQIDTTTSNARTVIIIGLVTFLVVVAVFVLGSIIIMRRTSQEYRPDLYFDDAIVTDIDQYH